VGGPVGIVIDRLFGCLEFRYQPNIVFARIGVQKVVRIVAAGNLDPDAMPAQSIIQQTKMPLW